jgi:pimeloyl-ACP methyl ester carboxylesterase
LLRAVRVKANRLELEYESFGESSAPLMVLVSGFSQQLLAFDEVFCSQLAARGFRVVRFDNRDTGLSTKLEGAPPPKVFAILSGDESSVAYSIEDMADDTAGLITALGGPAHVVGISMGAMIAQSLAIRHPSVVSSLASVMSSTGDRAVGQATSEALSLVGRRSPTERSEAIDHGVAVWRVLRSPGYATDEARAHRRIAQSYDRSFYPAGAARQLGAIVSQRDRTRALAEVKCPTVVIHGSQDPLIDASGGEATARAIPGSRLLIVPGMGHDLPEAVWPVVQDAIEQNARRAR